MPHALVGVRRERSVVTLDTNGHQIRPDGTFRDEFTIERGYWEAKDTDDDLEAEIKKKIKRGYRLRFGTVGYA